MDNAHITAVHTVAVPVTDQDRTKDLFERLGFRTTMDTELQPGFRWIELSPAGARGIDILTPVGHGLGEEAGHDDRFAEGDVAARGIERFRLEREGIEHCLVAADRSASPGPP